MKIDNKLIITAGIGILILTIIFYYIFMVYKNNSQVDIPTIIKTKQIIKHKYKPQSYPKTPIIPKKLFQTWHSKDLPPKMQENIVNIQKQNPELEYFLFDDNDCVDFIGTHFDNDVLDAYNKLIPEAYKADLWRYCVMYIHGGVYLDIKYQCVDGFKFIDIMDREHFVLDIWPDQFKPGTHGIYNALIIAKPGNPIFLKCIKQIVIHTQNNYYGFNYLYPTGPGLLGELYFGNINNNIDMLDKFDLVHNNIDSMAYVIYKNQFILKEYPEYRTEQRANQKHKHYGELWKQRAIYNQ
jgi:hypothetical protein